MRKHAIRILEAAAIVLGAILPAAGASADDAQFMIQPPAGFTVKAPVSIYNRANLYEYIDGQAVFYNKYGFNRLEHAVFGRDGGSYTVDIYELGSRLSAFGSFRQQRETEAADYTVGAEGALIDYLTTFYKDRYYVEIAPQSNGDDADDLGAMKDLSEWVDNLLPGEKALPPEVTLLPGEGLVPKSERYVDESLISYAFMGRGLTALYREPGQKKDLRVFIGFAPDSVKADEIFAGFAGKMTNLQASDQEDMPGIRGELPYRGLSVAFRSGLNIFGAMGITDEKRTIDILSALGKNLRKYDEENERSR